MVLAQLLCYLKYCFYYDIVTCLPCRMSMQRNVSILGRTKFKMTPLPKDTRLSCSCEISLCMTRICLLIAKSWKTSHNHDRHIYRFIDILILEHTTTMLANFTFLNSTRTFVTCVHIFWYLVRVIYALSVFNLSSGKKGWIVREIIKSTWITIQIEKLSGHQ